MIKANPLNNVEYVSKDQKDGHSLFLYEINVVNCSINGRNNSIFNYNKNTINSMRTNPFVNFDMKFSPISVEYSEGDENFVEFLTYLLGMTGGTLSIIRIFNNILYSAFFKKEHTQIPTSEVAAEMS